ncbi:uncharacterized protein LOC119167773 isoform X3 [Rhipicephalus microplus]|uniref:uncharacterized protein LOC119167773 isoform X3 n=1 Tax=Rhipicephalus microplus TaxID=6941 RepID=UPI003F6BCDD4
MAILSRCCFVCSVRDGTLIIGITCIVCRVLASIACVVLLASYAQENNAEQGGTVRYNLTSLKLLLPDNLLVMLFSGLLVIGLVKVPLKDTSRCVAVTCCIHSGARASSRIWPISTRRLRDKHNTTLSHCYEYCLSMKYSLYNCCCIMFCASFCG